jgi:signal transduction histidine kinase
MPISVPSLQRSSERVHVLDPTAIVAYLTWAAVATGPLIGLSGSEKGSASTGLTALVAFLLLFIARGMVLGERVSLPVQRALVMAQAAAALTSCWAFRDGIQPTLLVIVAAQLPGIFSWRALAAVLLAINGALAALLLTRGIPGTHGLFPFQLLVAFIGFQAFALLVITALRQANDARDAAQQINAELIATRHLLGEGARAEERLRLSRELHDVAGHKLTALKMQLRQAHGASADVAACEQLADELLTDIRGVVGTLRQHEGVDLQQALRALDPRVPGFAVSFDLDPAVRVADMRRAEGLLRCAQEALTNALRHSGAEAVRLSLRQGAGGIELRIEDDGRGRAAALQPGNGLRGLQERMRELGGSVELRDGAPKGLVLQAVLPAAP